MQEAPLSPDQARDLRFLRRIVTVLTLTMIGGLLAIVALLVIRFAAPQTVALPHSVTLPAGQQPVGYARGADWFAVVTDARRILIFDAESGDLRQTVEIESE